jgi:hypothetical protein
VWWPSEDIRAQVRWLIEDVVAQLGRQWLSGLCLGSVDYVLAQ